MLLYCLIACAAALMLMLLVMPKFLPYLKKLKFGQTIYELGPQAHLAKQGTPNMGGIVIAGATLIALIVLSVVYTAKGGNSFGLDNPLWALLVAAVGSMAVGFADDYIKDVKKNHEGLKPKQKLMGQVVVGLLFSLYCYFFVGSDVIIPFTGITWDLGIFYIPIMTVLVMFMTNSANLQDGVDGLLSSVTVVGMAAFGLIAVFLLQAQGAARMDMAPAKGFGYGIMAIGCFALVGACLGFLRFNRHPAKIFMGDTGSMFIGGMMVGVSMLMKLEFLLIPICFTCMMSSVSVMLQTGYFKITKKKYGQGKRIFKMAPIHHHFELCGMNENQIVLMYAAVTLVLSLLGVWSLHLFY
ncbi:MAG: phospho-N-acetylmuramoyl-pentapeptide-transferase [Clostridia bacterium]|nr:phospho-N-acetylmuramoyl-pentapeptide-transferase [Clostridia bacterium]